MKPRTVHLVIVDGAPHVLAAYWNGVHAGIHARTVTGASPVLAEVLERLPDSVRELLTDDFDGDDTPVMNTVPIMEELARASAGDEDVG